MKRSNVCHKLMRNSYSSFLQHSLGKVATGKINA